MKLRFDASSMWLWLAFSASCALTTTKVQAEVIADVNVLERLFATTDGDRWVNHTGWNTTTAVCSWHGIVCSDFGQVVEINLENNNLVGRIPHLVYQMGHLKVLNVKDNSLRSAGWEDIEPGTVEAPLELLNFAGNGMKTLDGVDALPSAMKELHVTENLLVGAIPRQLFTSLSNLVTLYVSFNTLSGTLPTEIGQMSNLEYFYAYNNDMSGTIPSEVGLLTRAKVFTVAENRFSGTLPREVSNMINLETFSVHNNEEGKTPGLSGTIPWFNKSPFLNQLYLDGNSFIGTIPPQLLRDSNQTESLVTIGLSGNLLTGTVPTSLLKFESLFFNLVGNNFSTNALSNAFCTKSAWMSGLVEEYKCDAIMCPVGTFAPQGKATAEANCTACPTSTKYMGATNCPASNGDAVHPEWLILANFYQATGGPTTWNVTDGWSALDDYLDMLDTYDGSGIKICDGSQSTWHGVICDNGLVDGLNLRDNGLIGSIPAQIFTLPKLMFFDVSYNPVVMEEDDLGVMLKPVAKTLRTLNLSGTKIKSLNGVDVAKSLRFLFADGLTSLSSTTFPTHITALTDLTILHMQFSLLTGTIPTTIGKLTFLEQLNLYNNDFKGKLPSEIGRLSNMTVLELSENSFTGQFPTQLAGLSKLQKLRIHQEAGGMTGKLPAFNSLTRLTELTLDKNMLTGPIPTNFIQGISNKTAYTLVSLVNNNLTGTVPAELNNFNALDIRLEGNEISGIASVLCDNPNWMKGEVGKLMNNNSSDPCNAILCPKGTSNAFGKEGDGDYAMCVDCTKALYFGTIICGDTDPNPEKTVLDNLYKATGGPYWKRSGNWTSAGVPICFREGVVCSGSSNDTGVTQLELLGFGLKGIIPPEIFDLPEIKSLGFTDNQVNVSFSAIKSAKKLVVLKLSNTQVSSMSGIENVPAMLDELHLASNHFTGEIPTEVYALTNLKTLFLNDNEFTGTLSSEVSKLSGLELLQLGGTKLTGPIPTEIGMMQNLQYLRMEENYFSGNIPTELNDLTNLKSIMLHGQKSHDKLTGQIVEFSKSAVLNMLDLSHNSLTGSIPDTFLASAPTDSRVVVTLEDNNIVGNVPTSLSRLNQLFMDITANKIDEIFGNQCSSFPGWMDGLVGSLSGSCEAIACSPGFASPSGRQVSTDKPCVECPNLLVDAPYYGATECKAGGQNNETEKNVLMEIFDRTNGEQWNDQTNWNSDQDVCSWFGITCDDNGVSEINLESNGLAADEDVSSLFFGLPNLKTLDIKGNDVILDLTKIPSNSGLQKLQLSSTGLTSLEGVDSAKNLRRLHVTDNELSGTFPSYLMTLTNLRSIFMSFNAFSGTLPSNIGDLNNIEELYLYGNYFNGTLPGAELAKMTDLRECIIANNYLTGTIPTQFNSMSKLEQLSLFDQHSDSLLSGTLPNFRDAPNLWYFDVTNNDLTGSIPTSFMGSSIYKAEDVTIYVSNNELTGVIPESLASFTNIDLEIVGNQITGLPQAFCSKNKWMQGQVEGVGCNAIACPPGTYNSVGRQDSSANPCLPCSLHSDDPHFGRTFCENTSTEKSTLLSLYTATGGTKWVDNAGWNTDEPICSWTGILCENGNADDDTGVTGIDLESNRLGGTMPSEIWKLPFLTSLNFKDNANLFISMDGVEAAKVLETMYFSGNRITSIKGVSLAKKLRNLHLTGCGISGSFPDEIFNLAPTLEGLFIAYNAFSGTIPTRLGELSNLNSFYAFDNDFSGQIPTEIGKLTALENFVVSENLLSGPIPSQVSAINTLKLFSAYRRDKPGPKLTGPLPSFDTNPQLEDLYLDNNNIASELPPNFLRSSGRVGLVTLSYNYLSGVVPASLTSIDGLNLQLESNDISAFAPAICNMTDWMEGHIGTDGCDAFLCPPGKHSPIGRANGTFSCKACDVLGGAEFYGSTSCETLEDERKILVNFFQKCGGTDWNRQGAWTTSEAYCTWEGIDCRNGRVYSIKLGSNNIVGTPPKELFNLPELEILELYSNPINFKFTNIESAKKLTTLRLDSTGLKSLDGVGKAPSLAFLDVRFNALTGKFNEAVLRLKKLRYLNMGNNQLTGAVPDSEFSKMPYLKSLRLGNNNFSGVVPSLHLNNRLTNIDISDNKLAGRIPSNFLNRMTTTTPIEIDLSGNDITGQVPEQLSRFDVLTIYLRGNKITDMSPVLCARPKWNGGGVGKYGCNALLCPPGTYGLVGRERDQESCIGCLDDPSYFGQTTCTNPGSYAVRYSIMFSAVWALFATAFIL